MTSDLNIWHVGLVDSDQKMFTANITNIKITKNSQIFTSIKLPTDVIFHHFKHFKYRHSVPKLRSRLITKFTDAVRCHRLQ